MIVPSFEIESISGKFLYKLVIYCERSRVVKYKLYISCNDVLDDYMLTEPTSVYNHDENFIISFDNRDFSFKNGAIFELSNYDDYHFGYFLKPKHQHIS